MNHQPSESLLEMKRVIAAREKGDHKQVGFPHQIEMARLREEVDDLRYKYGRQQEELRQLRLKLGLAIPSDLVDST